jgi:tellurite resistance protein
LIALSSANGNVDKQKIIWIETLHTQWIKNGLAQSYPQLNGTRINRIEMSKIAAVSAVYGPYRVIDALQRRKNQMKIRDKEILIKLCFFLATLDGPMSRAESALIVEIASAVGISRERMLCWK